MAPGYVVNPYMTKRRATREVRVGDVGVGGDNPIRIQSMTNTDTMDTCATVDQIECLVAAGCEIARVTAPSMRDAENLREIKAALQRRGVRVPLVADIHFTPNAAMIAAECVEKVRINPGNYADKKKFKVRDYSESEYRLELERVAERFRPLVRRCRENGVAMRIGTNHGSLSDRIMNRHGDSPSGMVESALEFLAVCEDEGYADVIFSMKSSNTHVAIQAYRLLAARLEERSPGLPSYPLHLGVTEAGDALDGRIKSAIGIGSLLEDGIGDTIRVSLTENPVEELPVARLLARRSELRWLEDRSASPIASTPDSAPVPDEYARRRTHALEMSGFDIGGAEPIRVELEMALPATPPEGMASSLAASLARFSDIRCEGLLVGIVDEAGCSGFPAFAKALAEAGVGVPCAVRLPPELVSGGLAVPSEATRVVIPIDSATPFGAMRSAALAVSSAGVPLEWTLRAERDALAELVDRALLAVADVPAMRLVFSVACGRALGTHRLLAACLDERGVGDLPIVLRFARRCEVDLQATLVDASIELGAPLCDGIGDALGLAGFGEPGEAVDIAYRILQGARLRTTRTEYISCPSCGRTRFDLEATTARIKERTAHLKGVKIAIMGCIVNGPGEMADADFGYVGSGNGMVTLYRGKRIVARDIPEADAPDRLVELIRASADPG